MRRYIQSECRTRAISLEVLMGSHLKRPGKQIKCRCIKHQNCQLSTWPKAELLRSLSSVSPPSIYRSSSWCIGSIWIRPLDFLYPLLDPSHSRPWLSKGSWIHPELDFISSGIGGLFTKKAGCLLHSHRKTCLKNFLISVSVAIQNKVLKKKKECSLEYYKQHSKSQNNKNES